MKHCIITSDAVRAFANAAASGADITGQARRISEMLDDILTAFGKPGPAPVTVTDLLEFLGQERREAHAAMEHEEVHGTLSEMVYVTREDYERKSFAERHVTAALERMQAKEEKPGA